MKIKVTCNTCGLEFLKDSYQVNHSANHFCTKSCSAKNSNKVSPKRLPQGRCKTCDKRCRSGYSYCDDHKIPRGQFTNDWSSITYGQTKTGKGTNRNSRIREVARKLCRIKVCQKCGYDKHVEIHHIKSISSFPDTATVMEINASDNLLALCPNCHWEAEHLDKLFTLTN